jgi:biopolymer transport protein ExbD
MAAPARVVARIAIILILLGIALPAGYEHWFSTRTFVALDTPVSLHPGHIKTPDFEINLEGWYEIWINARDQVPEQDCRYSASDVSLKTHYTVHRDGLEVAHSDGEYQYLGHFFADRKGLYGFDIEVVSDVACLNSRQPRITVWTRSDRYDLLGDELLSLSIVLVLSGLGVLSFSTVTLATERKPAQEKLSIVDNVGCEYLPSRRHLPLKARFSRPPSFGLFYSLILASVLIPSFLIFLGYNPQSVGIEVHLLHPGPLRAPADSWTTPLVVRVENSGVGGPPRLYLNSSAIAWEALSPALKAELKSRSQWLVYVEADSGVSWGDAVNAMDIIRAAGAKVVLLTTEPASSRANSVRPTRH